MRWTNRSSEERPSWARWWSENGYTVALAVILVLLVVGTIVAVVSDRDFGRPACTCPTQPVTRWHFVTAYDAQGHPCGGNLLPYTEHVTVHTPVCQSAWDAQRGAR